MIDINFSVTVDDSSLGQPLDHDSSQDVVPDFIDGWAFGHAIGLAFRSSREWWTLQSVQVGDSLAAAISLSVGASHNAEIESTRFRVAPHQTRTVPLEIKQVDKITAPDLPLVFTFSRESDVNLEAPIQIRVMLPLRHTSYWASNASKEMAALRATHFTGGTPFMFLAKPPYEKPGKVPSIMMIRACSLPMTLSPAV